MNGLTILLTGGTGSFGKEFIKMTLAHYTPKKIIVYSRDEMKQWEMSRSYLEDLRVDFVIGDVRDSNRLKECMRGVDLVVHAAATKIVPTAEYNPIECIKTNINGAENVIQAAMSNSVSKVVALSTDKASSPINLYGATKLASDKLFIAANTSSESSSTRFSVVRYGNVMGSRGSVIPFFIKQSKDGVLSITDERMTRFMITLGEGVKLVWKAVETMRGGEVYVKKIPSMKVTEIARTIDPDSRLELVGIRPGEKIHEQMIGEEDSLSTYEYDDHYRILPMIHNLYLKDEWIAGGTRVPEGFSYKSNTNSEWMTREDLKKWLANYEIHQ